MRCGRRSRRWVTVRRVIPGWFDWCVVSESGGSVIACEWWPSPPPATPWFLLSGFSPCFVGFAAYWSGPCGLYRDHLLHLMGFIKATPGLLASHLPGAWLALGRGQPACGRVGPACRLLLTPVYQILHKIQV